jgi:hypothetical protein
MSPSKFEKKKKKKKVNVFLEVGIQNFQCIQFF